MKVKANRNLPNTKTNQKAHIHKSWSLFCFDQHNLGIGSCLSVDEILRDNSLWKYDLIFPEGVTYK